VFAVTIFCISFFSNLFCYFPFVLTCLQRDALNKKVESLSTKAEQLASLLRSVQQAQQQQQQQQLQAMQLQPAGFVAAGGMSTKGLSSMPSFRMGGNGTMSRFNSTARMVGPPVPALGGPGHNVRIGVPPTPPGSTAGPAGKTFTFDIAEVSSAAAAAAVAAGAASATVASGGGSAADSSGGDSGRCSSSNSDSTSIVSGKASPDVGGPAGIAGSNGGDAVSAFRLGLGLPPTPGSALGVTSLGGAGAAPSLSPVNVGQSASPGLGQALGTAPRAPFLFTGGGTIQRSRPALSTAGGEISGSGGGSFSAAFAQPMPLPLSSPRVPGGAERNITPVHEGDDDDDDDDDDLSRSSSSENSSCNDLTVLASNVDPLK
jgi:hypothetical protein